jgi:hypothetical protein
MTWWFAHFHQEADEQGGRVPSHGNHFTETTAAMLGRIDKGRIWLWVDDSGERVHLTGVNPPTFGVARIGPVDTPPGQRGRGYAGAAVARGLAGPQRQGCSGLPFHGPGESDIERTLRTVGVPTGGGHGGMGGRPDSRRA